MKKLVLLSAALACLTVTEIRAGTIHIDFSLGILATQDGTPVSDGSLVQIIAAPTTSTFADPTATDFLGGSSSEYLVYSGAFDSTTVGVPGAETLSLNIDLATYPISGDALLVRWYPSLITSSSAPGSLTHYGQFGYPNNPSSLDLTNTWVAPSAGGSASFSFQTSSAGGSYSDSIGYASNVTPVPEPSSSAIVIALCALAVTIHHRRRAVQAGR